MDRETILELWEDNNDRPAFVREHREEIHAHTDLNEPIPDGSLAQVRRWLDKYKAVVTRQLGETPTDTGDEGGA